MIRILTIILLFLTNESNGMNRKHSETDDNIKESSTSLSPHDDVMRRILRSRAGESVNVFKNIAPVSMQNGVFLKGDLHVRVPVKVKRFPNLTCDTKRGGHFQLLYIRLVGHEKLVKSDRRAGAIKSISYTIKQPRVGNIFFRPTQQELRFCDIRDA